VVVQAIEHPGALGFQARELFRGEESSSREPRDSSFLFVNLENLDDSIDNGDFLGTWRVDSAVWGATNELDVGWKLCLCGSDSLN
jgi:hypothetical protein